MIFFITLFRYFTIVLFFTLHFFSFSQGMQTREGARCARSVFPFIKKKKKKVPSGLRQRPSRRPVSPSPAPTSRVVYTHDRLSVFAKTVAGSNSFFATSATHRCSIYFSPFRDPRSAGTDAFLQYWDGLQAYAFHPVAVVRVFSRSSGPPRGWNSLLWLSTGLSALGFRTWSSSRWLLQ